jgi:histidyl-tRNA synthetase
MKGFRDFYPEEKRKENYIFNIWKKIAERYGYSEIDMPILEDVEVYNKSGEEIPEQIYRFKDKKGREVALRPETTPSIARMIKTKGDLKRPVKWYSISQCYRYENIQRGRGREFFQLNVDYLGSKSMQADAEIIVTLIKTLEEFKLNDKDFCIKISNRKLMEDVFKNFKIKNSKEVSRILDKRGKISDSDIKKELKKLKMKEEDIKDMFNLFEVKDIKDIEIKSEGYEELKEVFSILKKYGMEKYCKLDLGVMRGFDYYTGTVFEAFDLEGEFRSIAGGGRYDNLAGMPGVGYGFGDIVLELFLEKKKKLSDLKNETDVLLIPINTLEKCYGIAEKLRNKGVNVSLDLLGRGISKNLNYADKMKIPYAVIAGEDELGKGKVKLKDMESGKEQLVEVKDIKKNINKI